MSTTGSQHADASVVDVTVTIECECSNTPSESGRRLRFQFLNNENVETPNIATWEAVVAPSTESTEAEAGVGDDAGVSGSDEPLSLPPKTKYSFQHKVSSVEFDDSFCRNLHQNSVIWFMMSEHPSEDGDSAAAGVDHYRWAGCVDLSPLLANHTAVHRLFIGTAFEATKPFRALAPCLPDGLNWLSITVQTDNPCLSPAMLHELNPLRIELQRVQSQPGIVLADGDVSLQRFVQPSRFRLLQELCHPTYCSFQVFDGDLVPRVVCTQPTVPSDDTTYSLQLNEEAQETTAEPHGDADPSWFLPADVSIADAVNASSCTVWLTGMLDTVQIKELIVQNPIAVELHDRDTKQYWERLSSLRAHCNAVVRGEEAIADDETENAPTDSTDVPSDVAPTDEGATTGSVAPEPKAPRDVDPVYTRGVSRLIKQAGDHNTHGVAYVRFDALLDRGDERRALLKARIARAEAIEREAASVKAETSAAKAERKKQQRLAALRRIKREKWEKEQAQKASAWQAKVAAAESAGEPAPVPAEGEMGDAEMPAELKDPADEAATPSSTSTEQQSGANTGAGSAEVTWSPDILDKPIQCRMAVDVVPSKKRFLPKGGESKLDQTEEERIVEMPGAYTLSNTRIKMNLTLHRPLYDAPPKATPTVPMFERAVCCMRYKDDAMLKLIQVAFKAVNKERLNVRSLTTVQYTDEQLKGANDGSLDVLSGFQVVDDHWRLVVVEGLGGEGKGMEMFRNRVKRLFPNTRTVKYLANPDVRFMERLYGKFNAALKQLRLRDLLAYNIRSPAIYDRSRVSQLAFEGLNRLFGLRRVDRLIHAKMLSLFPDTDMILELENKYGDTVTLRDMNGAPEQRDLLETYGGPRLEALAGTMAGAEMEQQLNMTKQARASVANESPRSMTIDLVAGGDTLDKHVSGQSASKGSSRHKQTRNPRVTPRNEPFEQSIAARQERDWVVENKHRLSELAESKTAERMAQLTPDGRRREEMKKTFRETGKLPDGTVPTGEVFMYSSQKLNTTELQKEAMRKRLAADKHATFSYSQEYMSQTLCMVNESEIELDAKKAIQAKFKTPKGFMYPAPKSKEDFARSRVPLDVSESRKADLAAPFEEDPGNSVRGQRGGHDSAPVDKPPMVVSAKLGAEFGYVDAKGIPNPDFFKSIHLGGEAMAREMQELAQKEKEQWEKKVVVDSTRFNPHHGVRHRESQTQKVGSLLDGPVKSKSLRIIHNARLPSGKQTAPPVAAPVNALMSEEYGSGLDISKTFRTEDPSKMVATDSSGKPLDFARYLGPSAGKSKAQASVAKRKHPPLQSADFADPRFGYK